MKLRVLLIAATTVVIASLSASHSEAFTSARLNEASSVQSTLPGTWRPFSSSSPWNTPIAQDAHTHPESEAIISNASTIAAHVRFGETYLPPVWVVDSDRVPLVKVRSDKIYDRWDRERRGTSDVGVPVSRAMYPEPTKDGHIVIVDPKKQVAWEMSRFSYDGDVPTCTTFNVWDLSGPGFVESTGQRWWSIGGRGSGFPIIAGLLRPEEVKAGEVRHALVFTFPKNRRNADGKRPFLPPAARSDGQAVGDAYPIEGMRFQLDPSLTDADFEKWGLSREAKIVAKALQRYGMFDGDNGGAFALQVQLLAPSAEDNRKKWDEMFPGLYASIRKIPSSRFRVIYTGEPIAR